MIRSKTILQTKSVVVKQLHEPNLYQIRPVNSVGPEWVVNCRQLQDLQKAHGNSDNTSGEEMGSIQP